MILVNFVKFLEDLVFFLVNVKEEIDCVFIYRFNGNMLRRDIHLNYL